MLTIKDRIWNKRRRNICRTQNIASYTAQLGVINKYHENATVMRPLGSGARECAKTWRHLWGRGDTFAYPLSGNVPSLQLVTWVSDILWATASGTGEGRVEEKKGLMKRGTSCAKWWEGVCVSLRWFVKTVSAGLFCLCWHFVLLSLRPASHIPVRLNIFLSF